MGLFNHDDKLTAITGGLNKRLQTIFGDKLRNTIFPNYDAVLEFIEYGDVPETSFGKDAVPDMLIAEVSVHIHPDDYVEDGFAAKVEELKTYMEIYYEIPVVIDIKFV